MIRGMLLGIIGGLGLFLFGMLLMSDGLKQVAGRKLKTVLETMTKNTYVGFVVGPWSRRSSNRVPRRP